jgi:hypothetical protein
LNVAKNVTFNGLREEKKDGKQDGGQMKITVSREELKQIIKEEWEREMLLEMHDEIPMGYDETVQGQDQELDYEGYMTKSQLYKIGEAALKLHDMIEDGENLPEWMQSKIAQAEQMIQSAYNAFKYDKVRGTV